jgi:AcrR family transcriptional regulator
MTTHTGPRRLPPDARRRQIVNAARQLLSERGDTSISTADVAAAAGVTRALVHHYFHGIAELLDAVTGDLAATLAAASLGAGTDIPAQQRIPGNIAALLDMMEANRGVWLAAIAARTTPDGTSPGPDPLRQAALELILANNSDLIADTPWARLCLTGYVAYAETIARQWLAGHASRHDTQRALASTLLHLLTDTIPGR